jgi:hypothetical protein
MAKSMTPAELEWKPGPVPPPTEQFAVVLTWHDGVDQKDLIGDKVRLAPSFRTIIASQTEGFEELRWIYENDGNDDFWSDEDPAKCDWWACVGSYDTPADEEP